MEMKPVFLFPGQGSQEIRMGEPFLKNASIAEEIFSDASDVLGRDLKELCLSGPEDELTSTEWAQPAILTVSAVVYRLFVDELEEVKPVASLGHSLGEYTALYSAGTFNFGQAVELVHERGNFINSASGEVDGTMSAIIGLEDEQVVEICEEVSKTALVELANFNSPGQVVITGSVEGVKMAMERANEAGARRAIELEVSGPFHSSMLKPAGDRMEKLLREEIINEPAYPVYSNVTAEPHTTPDEICELLGRQIYSPVLFRQSIEGVWTGDEIFVEFGSKVVSGLVKRIARKANIYSITDMESLARTVEELKEL